MFVVEAIKYAVEHREYRKSAEGSELNEFSNLPGDEFDEEEDIECNAGEPELETPIQNDLYDEDIDPEVLNVVDEEGPEESLEINSTAQVYTSSTGKIAVPQHIHYAHSGLDFKNYSLYEFAAIVDIVEKKKQKKQHKPTNDESLSYDAQLDEEEENPSADDQLVKHSDYYSNI